MNAGVLEDRGSIDVGKRADLVLIDGDPVAHISDVRRVATVLKGVTVYYPSEIYEALGIKPFAAPVKVRRPAVRTEPRRLSAEVK